MRKFFIEMGQGIMADRADGDFGVCTSALFSCVLIAGYNEASGFVGAYHYPANRIEDPEVISDMNEWAFEVEPTSVVLIFARDAGGSGQLGTTSDDRHNLQEWVRHRCGVDPQTLEATAAAVSLIGGHFHAGRSTDIACQGIDQGHSTDVSRHQKGIHMSDGGFILFGRRR
ncbi:MAG: hypothetical protein KGL59_02825 [Acidobacteriota bacterium]|nr:hypothetical protein [Acidobacteriota bacterium]